MMVWEDKLAGWWSAWKYVAILAALLLLSAGWNVHQFRKLSASKAECKAKMLEAATLAITNERERAARADKQAGEIVNKTKGETAKAVARTEGQTNDRAQAIRNVVVRGDCRMPRGLPDLSAAAREANAAAGVGVR